MKSFSNLSTIRNELIQAISSLPSLASKNLVLERIQKHTLSFQEEFKKYNDKNRVEELDTITPLMIACERGQVEVIRYILSERIKWLNQSLKDDGDYLTLLFGHPLQMCKMYGGNGAMHFLAVSNSSYETWNVFQELFASYYKTNNDSFVLLKQQNSNNDTPIMIATVKGNINFLRHVLFTNVRDINNVDGDINAVLQMKNNQNETVLKLAFGHGQYDILKLLIHGYNDESSHNSNYKLTVTNKDASECQRIYNHMENTLQWMSKGTNTEQWEQKMLDTKKCLILINIAAEKHCRKMENELLLEESNMKKGRKKKTKAKKKKSNKNHNSILNETNEMKEKNEIHHNTRFITLEDGSIVSSSNSNPYHDMQSNVDKVEIIEKQKDESKSLESMLRDRFCTTNENNEISSIENDKIEQSMNSLCLDVSMLLLTPHGMAMKLSPCQLDAVERLLRDQVDAVMEARQIQDRLLDKKTQSP